MTTLDMTPDGTSHKTLPSKTAPTWFVVAAWSVPALLATDYLGLDLGYLAMVPVVAMLIATLSQASVRALRWWVGAMTALIALPMAFDGDTGAGYFTDMHPINLALFVVAAVVVLVKVHRSHR